MGLIDEEARRLREDIGEIVWQFEDRSSMVCEECGFAGETRTVLDKNIVRRLLCEAERVVMKVRQWMILIVWMNRAQDGGMV